MAKLKNNNQENNYLGQEPELKTVYVAISGTDKAPILAELAPGCTSLDLFEQLHLNGYRLVKPGGSFFALGDDLYTAVDNYQKLHASKADVEAGDTSDVAGSNG